MVSKIGGFFWFIISCEEKLLNPNKKQKIICSV